jgi:hypothetical protein
MGANPIGFRIAIHQIRDRAHEMPQLSRLTITMDRREITRAKDGRQKAKARRRTRSHAQAGHCEFISKEQANIVRNFRGLDDT